MQTDKLYVVIGEANVKENDNWFGDSFICENDKSEQILSESEAKELKKELDKLFCKDYSYKVAELSFLD